MTHLTNPSRYLAPAWLPGGHAQTIYPATCIVKPPVAYRRERWRAPDGDFIDVDFLDGQADKPFVVLFHGLEGSSASHYARALMSHVAALGWSGAVPHFRGCSGQMNDGPRFYHSGDAAEIDWVLRKLAARRGLGPDAVHTPFASLVNSDIIKSSSWSNGGNGDGSRNSYSDGSDIASSGGGGDSSTNRKLGNSSSNSNSKFYAAGVSLGGNALLRWVGESQHQAGFVDAACAISAPLDLAAGGAALSRGLNMLYTRVFLRTLKPKCLQKLAQFPGLFDSTSMLNARNLYEFDNIVTAPLHGYRNTDDYWNRASARHILGDVTVPTLVLNARNDPFLPQQHLPQSAAAQITLEYPQQGGHVGFVSGRPPGALDWLPHRMVDFLEGRG
ncbi:MAG: YheT family hydrolase [Janthinobacterium lividum]